MELVELNTANNQSVGNIIAGPTTQKSLGTNSDAMIVGQSLASSGAPIPNDMVTHSSSQRSHTNSRQPKHRELPVDVPDTFVGMAKQSPRYPPPKPHRQMTPVSTNNMPYHSHVSQTQLVHNTPSLNHHHHHQAPQSQAQLYSQGSNIVKSSLRDSVKLKQLEQTSFNGQHNYLQPAINQAFEPDDEVTGPSDNLMDHQSSKHQQRQQPQLPTVTKANQEKVPPQLPDLCAAYSRLQRNLNGEFADATNDANLPKLLSIYTTVMQQQHKRYTLPPALKAANGNTTETAIKVTDLLQSVISLIREGNVTNQTAELISILTNYEMDGLCSAFDRISQPFDFSNANTQSNGFESQTSPDQHSSTPYAPTSVHSSSAVAATQQHSKQHFEAQPSQVHSPQQQQQQISSPYVQQQQHPSHAHVNLNIENNNGFQMRPPIPDMDVDSGAYVRIACIEKSSCQPLGATVRNENDRVVIGRIVRGGAAEKSGLLHEGDEILQVNGIDMKGKSINQVFDILNEMKGTLTFMIAAREYARPPHPNQPPKAFHLKALFDYEAHTDPYIPCKELGISFNKGDILHVIDQSDPNWWQAQRDGDQSTLAGLIPSANFHVQRERILADTTNAGALHGKYERINKRSPASILLDCGKGTSPSRRKKSLNMMMVSDEIHTYEEVDLYYPMANVKRPIVMVGPTNIGRQELRLRLLQDKSRFAAATPHTTRPPRDGEKNGFDYYFVTRAQFDADIRAGKFVEHGEFERHSYGTTLDAIDAVVKSGKICVLNLHADSILRLRQSHAGPQLKPYFVFVKPPAHLDKLERLVASLKQPNERHPSSAELQKIVDESRFIHAHCKPYFDYTLPISDVDGAYQELLHKIRELERDSQWIPKFWSQDMSA